MLFGGRSQLFGRCTKSVTTWVYKKFFLMTLQRDSECYTTKVPGFQTMFCTTYHITKMTKSLLHPFPLVLQSGGSRIHLIDHLSPDTGWCGIACQNPVLCRRAQNVTEVRDLPWPGCKAILDLLPHCFCLVSITSSHSH